MKYLRFICFSILSGFFLITPTVIFAASVPNPSVPGTWQLTFADEFNGTSLATNVWGTGFASGQCQNGDQSLQNFVPQDDVESGGYIHLMAKRETSTCGGKTFVYSTGLINSYKSFAQRYGYFEIRMKEPSTNGAPGLAGGFWLLSKTNKWPPEIDIIENLSRLPTTAWMTLHYGPSSSPKQIDTRYIGPDLSQDFHTYAIDWEPNAITWYIDGTVRFKTSNNPNVPSEPMFMYSNTEIGGWAENPTSATIFPNSMDIDYIRVWQNTSIPNNGPTSTPFPTATPVPGYPFPTPIIYPTPPAVMYPTPPPFGNFPILGGIPTGATPAPNQNPSSNPNPTPVQYVPPGLDPGALATPTPGIVVTPIPVAATNPFPTSPNKIGGLIPCTKGYTTDPTTGKQVAGSCGLPEFITLIRNVINGMFIISTLLATIAFIVIGIVLLTAQGNVNKINTAKKMAINILIGFVIILAAWLIVFTITHALLDPSFNTFLK